MYKIWRSPYSDFADYESDLPNCDLRDETIVADISYTDAILAGIAEAGFNAIWVHGVLNHLVKVEPFLELGTNSERHLVALTRLVARAKGHGISVFVYMQPPRAIPASLEEFWSRHSDVAGQEEIGMMKIKPSLTESPIVLRSLCVSTSKVRLWLENAMSEFVRRVPGLGGVIVITASEHPSHCYSLRRRKNPTRWAPLIDCPRCRERAPEELPVDIIQSLTRGARKVSENFEIIAWNWSWAWEPRSSAKVIENLPASAILLVDFERGGVKDIPGRKNHLYDEYSLAYGGPSQRFLEAWNLAKNRGMRVMAKLQLGTTHELASVVSLPLLGNLFDKAEFIKRQHLIGFMGCWNFGNMLSANVNGFNWFLTEGCPSDKKVALEGFASRFFPGCVPELMRLAWQAFERAMEYFPFSIAFLYHGACSYTLGYHEMYVPGPLRGKEAGPSWIEVERGDNLENSYLLDHTEFTLVDLIERLGKVAAVWQEGITLMTESVAGLSSENVKLETGNAIVCGAVWRSVENTYKIYQMRSQWEDSMRERFDAIVADELQILQDVLPFVEQDARQGFHAEPQCYMFNAEKIALKIEALTELAGSELSGCVLA